MADWSHHLQSRYLHNCPPPKTFLFLSPSPHFHFNFPLRRNYSPSSFSRLPSSNNTLLIISTSEKSDGSLVFKFGDETQIIQENVAVVEDSADVSAKLEDNDDSLIVDAQCGGECDNLLEIVKDDDDSDLLDAQSSGGSFDSKPESPGLYDDAKSCVDSAVDAQSGGNSVHVQDSAAILLEIVKDYHVFDPQSSGDSIEVEDVDILPGIVKDNDDFEVVDAQVRGDSVEVKDSADKSPEFVIEHDSSVVDAQTSGDFSENNVSNEISVAEMENVDSGDTSDNGGVATRAEHARVEVIEEDLSGESEVDTSESVTNFKDLDTVMAADHSNVDVIEEELSDDSIESITDVKDVDTVMAVDHSHVDVIEEESNDDSKVESTKSVPDVKDLDTVMAVDHSHENAIEEESSDDGKVGSCENVSNLEDLDIVVPSQENEVSEDDVEGMVELVTSDIDEKVNDVKGENGIVEEMVELVELPVQIQSEPILDEEVSSDLSEDIVALDSGLASEEVNDAAVATLVQSDDDLSRDLSIVADLGTSETSAETSLNRLNEAEISAPLLFLESAAASLTNSAEVLAGGEDAYFLYDNWFGVADGVGQWSFRGIDKGLYAREFMLNCEKLAQKSQNTGFINVKVLLQQSAEMTESTGSARVLVAHFVNQALHVANVGDSGFVVIRNGVVFKKSSPLVHEFNFPYAISSSDKAVETVEEYHVELEDGDIVVTATDGLFDNLYEQEIVSIASKAVESGKSLQDLAELLATKAQDVGTSVHARTPFADAAQAAGHAGFNGGKFDHVTVLVSMVQRR